MTKDFNKDLDQTDGDRSRATGRAEGRPQEKKPEESSEAARERSGEGFESAADEYKETGAGGAGYREKSADPADKSRKTDEHGKR
jgi:hypothetical protein